ncbi:MAG: hypothetical protein QOE23_1098 [Pseudonocardiales bacterium]|jgi:hypothetical protein|nr:hypothetical protein [Pseudonocardiales bacterium]
MPVPAGGIDGWPGTECCYRIAGTDPRPELAVTVSTRPDWAVPGPDEAPQRAARRAGEQAGRYRLIGAQLDGAAITVSLLCTVGGDPAMPVADGAPSLRRFARAAELFAGAMAAATAPELAGIATLGELLDRYGLLADQLAAANADRPLNGLLAAGQALARRLGQPAPDTVPADGSTLTDVAAGLNVTAGRLLADNRGLRLAAEPIIELPGRMTLPVDARIPYSVQPGDTLAVLARRFGSTPAELVAGNARVAGTLPAGLPVRLRIAADAELEPRAEEDAGPADAGEPVTVSTETVAGDSFGSLHARLAEQHPGATLELVADALDRLGATLSPGPVLSCPLAVLGTGTSDDPVIGADVQAEYGCPPEAFAAANAAMLGLLRPGVRLDLDGARTTTTEHDTVHAVLDRLTADGIRPTVDRLLAGAAGSPLFRAGSRALLPPVAATLTASPGRDLQPPALAVPLVVTLRMEGSTPPAGGGTASVERADTQVPPSPDRAAFIDACLTALPALRLATDAHGALWAVSFGTGGIALVRIEPAAGGATEPQPFALRPLYPALVDLSIPIRPVTARGELGQPELREYHGLDVEPWARSFLADLDGYLAEPLLGRLPDLARDQLMDLRRQLPDALAAGVAPLRSGETGPHADAGLADARSALASMARTGLGEAYGASVLAQYRAVVVSPYGAAGRLLATVQESGRPDLGFSSGRLELNPSSATCTIALTCADPAAVTGLATAPRLVFDALELDPAGHGGSTDPVLLRFVRPLSGGYQVETLVADLPPAELPVPLREQPQPVPAEPMTTAATFAAAEQPTLAEAVQWTARLGYRHQHAAQDLVRVSITGRPPAPASRPGNGALAQALAGYLDASTRLSELIGTDVQPTDGIDAASLRGAAAATLTTLVAAVTAAWQGHWTAAPVAAGPAPTNLGNSKLESGFSGDYRLRAVYTASGGLDRLVVSRTAVAGNWPEIAVAAEDGLLSLTPGPVLDNSREYTAAGSLVTSPLTVRLAWPGLIGAPGPAARVTVTVERNAELPGTRQTNPAFVLTARPIQVTVPSPSLRWEQDIALPGADLVQALRDAFDVLAVGQPQHLSSFGVSYLELVDGLPRVRSALVGDLVLGPENAVQLATSMQDWQRKVQPATEGAVWQVRFAVPSARAGEPPLLTFDRLVFPVPAD